MTTHSQSDAPYPTKYRTELYLIYRIEDGQLETYGLFETRADAERELALVIGRDATWRIADVACIGWGILAGKAVRDQTATAHSRPPVLT